MIALFWLLLGLVGAIGFLVVARVKPEKELPTIGIGLVVTALIYVGFAVIADASSSWIATEILGVGIYGLLAVLGLRYSKWWLALGWILHPLWDIGLHFYKSGSVFTPTWYALACVSFDVLVAVYIVYEQVESINQKIVKVANPFEGGQYPVNFEIKRYLVLKLLIIACIISTAIHFTDNYLYIEKYPQPDWITASSIYISWVIWTAIGVTGYRLYKSGKFSLAYLFLVIYSFCGLGSLGHYLYGAMSEFSMKMHLFIITDGLTGLAILGFTLWSALILKEQFRESGSSEGHSA